MIIVAGWLRVDPSQREGYLAECGEVVELARSTEGCLDFALGADLLDPARINVFERWSSRAALEDFRGAGPPASQTELIVAAEVAEYETDVV